MLGFCYRLLTDLGAPLISVYLHRRLEAGREDAARFQERLGYASVMRPTGRLIWCHAASVGEAVSLMALVGRLRAQYPDYAILITTGTVTSARLLEGRLPPNVIHQYIPVDRMAYVTAFLDYWRPDFALWIESELWPNILSAMRERHIPAILLNARMSDASLKNWLRVKGWIREILSGFALCLTQTEDEKERFEKLGAPQVRCIGNIKYASDPLPCDAQQLAGLQTAAAGRAVWVMASTHRGEEEIALAAHRKLAAAHPNLLTVIVPRHAVRGEEIANLIRETALPFAQRSKQEALTAQTQIYLADTMGEMGLFYRLSGLTVMGGSFVPVGGHNPIEPAQLGNAVIFGPHMQNFTIMAQEFTRAKAALQIADAAELGPMLEKLLGDGTERRALAEAAATLAEQKRHVLDDVLTALKPWLVTPARSAA